MRFPPPEGLRSRVMQELFDVDDAALSLLVEHLSNRHGDAIAAVLFYGSCLFSTTRTPTSFHDLYALTDRPLRFYRSLWQVALNAVLPPNTYFGAAPAPGERWQRYKVCVMSVRQFRRQTSHLADDIHHLGRFSKRFAIAYCRDRAAADAVVDGAVRAMYVLVPHTLTLLPQRFTIDEFIRMQLGVSYAGERRVVEPAKVERLFGAAAPYYRDVYPRILTWYASAHGQPRLNADGTYQQDPVPAVTRRRTERFLRHSRVRGMLRWPKYLLTVDDWLEIELDKLERYHGIRLALTARERRYPLVFGWRKFFALRRQGIIR